MSITKITDPSAVPVAVADYEAQNNLIKTALTGLAKITLSNYDNDSAPAVKVGSIIDVGGATYSVSTGDETPSGYSGIAVSTTFYLYFDAGTEAFIYSATAPVWNDAYQGWYNSDDRAFFSMYKDSGGTLYQDKALIINQSDGQIDSLIVIGSILFPAYGSVGTLVTAASTAHALSTQYLPGTTVNGNTLVVSNNTGTHSSFGFDDPAYAAVQTTREQSLSLTGTWRLLSRVYRSSGSLYRPVGLWQRIS